MSILKDRRVKCRFCGEVIVLNPDGEDARKRGDDPSQQIRRHISEKHIDDMIHVVHACGWMIDRMFFESMGSKDDQFNYVTQIVNLSTHTYKNLKEFVASYRSEKP